MGSEVSSECNPGDLIEIFRDSYQHWALYMGDGYVVHLAPLGNYPGAGSCSAGSVLWQTAEVKRELLTDVAGSCRYRVNNRLDKELKPLPVEQILNSAKRMIGKKLPYGITRNNCEHFVTKLRYGEPKCQQGANLPWDKTQGVSSSGGTKGEIRGVNLIATRDHIGLEVAFKGPNVIAGWYECQSSLTVK
ncbi:LOW QUALITY PROTEIN: phospholipase A and acyltransferase 4-like [Phyllostomus hastatus]|uniref:LOW QUALITY PROTEIN: phospholipase A and acyltransferase 4-like n=1 Tax=Phyllostomus hastatus TaxID=9423 RepID=UPI001E682D69|nr:LOW QUALITY PROTEIN: phospholipase A and acyltransferase 4-like [Phyllostomus hastatus]